MLQSIQHAHRVIQCYLSTYSRCLLMFSASTGLFACWVILYVFCRILIFFQNHFFSSKTSFMYTVRLSNSLNLDQARRFVGPDLGSKYLQRYSANDTDRQRVNPAKSVTETKTVVWTCEYRNSGLYNYQINNQGVGQTATILVPRLCHSYMFTAGFSHVELHML